MNPDDFFNNVWENLNIEMQNLNFTFTSFNENIKFGFDPAREPSAPKEWHPRDQITKKAPRPGFVYGGYVLAETITVTRKDYIEMELDEWGEIQGYVERIPNFVVNHIPTGTPGEEILHVVDLVPTITTMEA